MTALEIILLLIGIICVAVSFIFFMKADGPEAVAAKVNVGLSDKQKEDIKLQISKAFEEEMEDMKEEVRERTENALEKLSNQKIQELSDYSETILSEINRNHTEVMFLYDMLNEKNKEVHNNIRDISIAADRLNEAKEGALAAAEALETKPKRTLRNSKKADTAKSSEEADTANDGAAPQNQQEEEAVTGESAAQAPVKRTKASSSKTTAKKNANKAAEGAEGDGGPEVKKAAPKRTRSGGSKTASNGLQGTQEYEYSQVTAQVAASAEDGVPDTVGDTQFMMGGNKKDAVLALHREGRSNVDIAKTLGLGIGEVKLVIDLFKGQK